MFVHPSAMAPTPRVESFEEMGAQRHKPVYAPSFPFAPASNPASLDPKVESGHIHHHQSKTFHDHAFKKFHLVWLDDHYHLQTTSKPGASSSSDSSSDSESDKQSESDEEAVKNDDGFGLGDIIRATKNSPRVGSMSDRSTKPTPSPR